MDKRVAASDVGGREDKTGCVVSEFVVFRSLACACTAVEV